MIALYIKKYPYTGRPDELCHGVALEMLDELYREKFNTPPPKIEKEGVGKPFFAEMPDGEKCFFNISHSKGYCAVLLTDVGECGVDIEPNVESDGIKKVETRFLSESLKTEGLDESIEIKTDGFLDGVTVEKCDFASAEKLPPVAVWTTLEALLKTDGRGFSAFKQRREIAKKVRTVTYAVSDSERLVYLTVAVEKN